jgi:hypothetical protein
MASAAYACEDVLVAGPHMLFRGLGRPHKEETCYRWAPVAYTDQRDENQLGDHYDADDAGAEGPRSSAQTLE